MLFTCYSHSSLPLNYALIYSVLQCRCIIFKGPGSGPVVQLAGTHHWAYQHRHSIGRLRHRVLTGILNASKSEIFHLLKVLKIWDFFLPLPARNLRFLFFFHFLIISKSEIFHFLKSLKIWNFIFFSFFFKVQNLRFFHAANLPLGIYFMLYKNKNKSMKYFRI